MKLLIILLVTVVAAVSSQKLETCYDDVEYGCKDPRENAGKFFYFYFHFFFDICFSMRTQGWNFDLNRFKFSFFFVTH